MSLFEIIAILLCLSALFSYINARLTLGVVLTTFLVGGHAIHLLPAALASHASCLETQNESLFVHAYYVFGGFLNEILERPDL